jgi:hypothetical protein
MKAFRRHFSVYSLWLFYSELFVPHIHVDIRAHT